MANERFMQLIKELHQASLDGRVRWQETAMEGVFRVGLGEGLVRIQMGMDDEEVNSYVAVHLLDKKGRTVDTLLAWENGEFFGLLQELYQIARSAALNVDQVVDSMLSDLKAGRTRELPPETRSDDVAF